MVRGQEVWRDEEGNRRMRETGLRHLGFGLAWQKLEVTVFSLAHSEDRN